MSKYCIQHMDGYLLVCDQLEAFQVPLECEKDAEAFISMGESYMNAESVRWTSGKAEGRFWKPQK